MSANARVRICSLAGLVLLLQAAVGAAAEGERQPRFERLENGLRLGVVEERGSPLASVQLWFEVGSAADPADSLGLCDVTRRVLAARGEASERLTAAGGRVESRTLKDACYFATLLPNDRVQLALEAEAARMKRLSASAEAVAAAVATVQRESAAAGGRGKGAARQSAGQLFEGHPYGRPGLSEDSLPRLTADAVNEFARRWFIPGNALVLVVGDVDAEATLVRMRELFEPLEWRQPPHVREAPLPEPGAASPAATQDSPAGDVTIAWLTPPARDLKNAAIDVLMHRLCNPVDGPLARRLAEMGYAPPRWRREQWRSAGMLVLETAGSAEARAAVTEEIERAAKSVPNEIELNRARSLVRRDRLWSRADFGRRALQLGWWDIVAGDLLLDDFERTAIRRLPVRDVQAAAAGLLHARQVVVSHREAADRDQPWRAGSAGPTAAPWEAALQAFETPPAIEGIDVKELRPGLRTVLKRVPGQEQTVIATKITATAMQEQAMSALMAVGSELHTVDEIRDYLTYRASEIYPFVNRRTPGAEAQLSGQAGLLAFGPSEYAPQLIELQAELLRRPQTSPQACARAAQLRQKYAESLRLAIEAGEVAAYVPSGFISAAHSAPEYPGSADEVREALASLHNIEQVEIVAIGDFSREDLLGAVEAAWPAAGGTSATQQAGQRCGGAASAGGHELCARRG